MHLMFPVVHSVSLLVAMYIAILVKNTNSNSTHATNGLVYTAEPSSNTKQLMRATKISNDTVICSCTPWDYSYMFIRFQWYC